MGIWLLAIGYLLLAIGYLLLAIGYLLVAMATVIAYGYWSLVMDISLRLLTIWIGLHLVLRIWG